MKATIHPAAPSLAIILLLGCKAQDSVDGPHPEPAEPPAVARLEAAWSRAVSEGVSAVALVRHRGEVLGAFSAGLSDRDQGVPNTLETVFDIGSITKQFTGAAVMRSYEHGDIDLQAPLASLLEGVPEDKAAITVHQLLTHSAGFAGALGDDYEPITREAYLERAWARPLSSDPGSLHWYSNAGYSILGALLEGVTQRSYEQYLVAELLRPAGVLETGFAELDVDPSRIAVGYAEGEADFPLQRPRAPDGYHWNLRANGGLLSTAGDLATWSDALFGGEVLGSEALELYLRPHVRECLGSEAHYAYGWAVSDSEAGRVVFHDGGNGFFFADVRRYVDADLLVIVLSNEANDVASCLPFELSHAVLPELPSCEDLPEEAPLALEREEALDDTTDSFVESIELGADQSRAVAGFFLQLEAGSARYTLRAPDGTPFVTGDARAGEPLERLVVVPPQIGRWQLEVDTEGATGAAFLAWAWD